MASLDSNAPQTGWRTPLVVVLGGCIIAMVTFGPRSSLGFFLTPLSQANGWGRDVFGLALAIQNLLWGVAQPFAGALADRYGTTRVLAIGAIIYAIGLAMMAYSRTPVALDLTAGVLIGFGLAGSSFYIVLSAIGKLVPDSWRSLAFGAGTAAGSFGQFLFSPLSVYLQDAFGWQTALVIFALIMLLVLPFSLTLSTPPASAAARSDGPEPQTYWARCERRCHLAPTICWCSAFSRAASSLPSSPCICRPISPTAASRLRSAAGPSP